MRVTEADLPPMVDALRARIGQEYQCEQVNRLITADILRRYALGIGDDNPLFGDPEYAAASPFGRVIAPPTFLATAVKSRPQGLRGVHALFAGLTVEFDRPVCEGDRLTSTTALDSLVEKQGKYSGKSYIQQNVFRHRNGDDPVATVTSYSFRTLRDDAKERGKYQELTRKTYTPEEIAEIKQKYREEVQVRRGAAPLDLAAVEVGHELPPLIKGPLSVADVICWLNGVGTGVFIRSSRQWYEYLERHPAAGMLDGYGVPDAPESVHWDEQIAAKIGMPGPYDYGWQRCAWLGHLVTDWIGDHAWVQKIKVELRAPNYVGDLTTVSGVVSAVDRDTNSLTVDMRAVDHRGRLTAKGQARVVTDIPTLEVARV
jgi:acyl dehydratase